MIACFIVLTLILLLYVFSYLFCLFNDRDALRSERFSIQKFAIEKGVVGDNLQGIVEIDTEKLFSLPPPQGNVNKEDMK